MKCDELNKRTTRLGSKRAMLEVRHRAGGGRYVPCCVTP